MEYYDGHLVGVNDVQHDDDVMGWTMSLALVHMMTETILGLLCVILMCIVMTV